MTKAAPPKKSIFRLRNWFVWLVPTIVVAVLYATDPDGGMKIPFATTFLKLLKVVVAFFVALALAHLGRRVLFDYPEADARSLFRLARKSSIGSSIALLAVSFALGCLLLVASTAANSQDVRTFIPPRCLENLSIMKHERMIYWASHPAPQLLPALAEHESCTSLTNSRCCNVTSRLKTAREEGAGLPQITRAYRKDGSLRFDALAEMREAHPALRELTWENVYRRADLQNRALILKMLDNFKFFSRFTDPANALKFADAGYNGGNGGVQNERRACGLTKGCDARKWPGNVELHCMKSTEALYGQRSACDINRFHVRDVTVTRAPKYRGLL